MLREWRQTSGNTDGVRTPGKNGILAEHRNHPAHFVSIQAGLFSGLAGHQVDEAFKVKEYDDEGNEVKH